MLFLAVINNSTLQEEINKNFEKVAPIAFIYERDTDNSKTISKSLKNFYFSEGAIDNSSLSNLVKVCKIFLFSVYCFSNLFISFTVVQ